MSENTNDLSFSDAIAGNLPFLRRYARALTGSQASGDTYAAAALEAILEDRSSFQNGLSTKTALFRVFHQIWSSSGGRTRSGLRSSMAGACIEVR